MENKRFGNHYTITVDLLATISNFPLNEQFHLHAMVIATVTPQSIQPAIKRLVSVYQLAFATIEEVKIPEMPQNRRGSVKSVDVSTLRYCNILARPSSSLL